MTRQKFTALAAEYRPQLLRFANSYFRDSRLAETVVSETIKQARETCETSKEADELPGYWVLKIASDVIRRWLKKTVHHNSRKPHEYSVDPNAPAWRSYKKPPGRVRTIPQPNPVPMPPLEPGQPVKDMAALYQALIEKGVLLADEIAAKKLGHGKA